MANDRRQSDNQFHTKILAQLVENGALHGKTDSRLDEIEARTGILETGLRTMTTMVEQIADDTSFMRGWTKDGAATGRFFCRLAALGRKGFKYVVLPIGVVMVIPYVVYAVWHWASHGSWPWLAQKAIELYMVIRK
jgi:hypothetical protein